MALGLPMSKQSAAQQQGDARVAPDILTPTQSLNDLEQLLRSPPAERKLNIYVAPQYRHEQFDAYTEAADLLIGTTAFDDIPGIINSPKFSIDAAGLSVGADYLDETGWLFGGALSYTHASFDYATPPESDLLLIDTTGVAGLTRLLGETVFGVPVDREYDEYGISFSFGYVTEPWTALLTAGYGHRNTEATNRKVGAFETLTGTLSRATELHGLEAEYSSDIYSVDLGGAYRIEAGPLSVQPYASIGYQVEDVDGYSESFTSLKVVDPTGTTYFTSDPRASIFDASSTVDGQTIHSIPGRVGMLFTTPLTAGDADAAGMEPWILRTGLSYTHDFADQERTIRSLRDDLGEDVVVTYEEENRNRDFFSLTGAIGFGWTFLRGSLNYQHDIGLDERESADIVSLQLRVPL
jgi:hypothetical protein